MAPPARSYHLHGLKLATIITVLFIFFFCMLFSKSGGSLVLERNDSLQDRKMVIGSKPPACLNKCMNCRPCIATLVVSQKRKSYKVLSRGDDNDTYYLLAWKCRCGNKVFQP
ncbi:EPIDERMAL PATTERNING FACTOR-like protein 8 [Medicago truncatula]|uniref:Epidermal patterning factor-like protein n=1 Tax=Medicago truncatula TaxID=3880 RepID=G7JGZ2_MEDTR|nr:EPIDERMAL PATTERNING FACTOR-like protein 8 [Medicago truncatula]AES86585.1 epidermal patterning factor-like protein, putative [Medicago truncatula]